MIIRQLSQAFAIRLAKKLIRVRIWVALKQKNSRVRELIGVDQVLMKRVLLIILFLALGVGRISANTKLVVDASAKAKQAAK